MKNFYYAVSESENGKNYAYVLSISKCNNLKSVIESYKNIKYINACESKKEAQKIVDAWIESYKQNKTYLFN
jgi:hypothetical protein